MRNDFWNSLVFWKPLAAAVPSFADVISRRGQNSVHMKEAEVSNR